MDYDIVRSLLVALALGFAIGMQRSLAYRQPSEHTFAGSRTFAFIAMGGFLAAWLEKYISGLILVTAAAVTFLLGLSYYLKVKLMQKWGMTTQIAALITFLLGLMVWYGLDSYAIFAGVIVIVLLEIKPRLQKFETHINSTDIHAVVLLLIMSFIVLPVLPDEMMGPYKLFNPYKTWMMAVVIAGISFVGYAAIKIFGQKHGVFLTGAAGGLISSTAVSISLSKLLRRRYELVNNYAGGIAIASTFMYIRVLFESFVVNPNIALQLLPSFGGAIAAGLVFSYILYRFAGEDNIDLKSSSIEKNPLQMSEAIKFGILFGIIYGAIAFVGGRYGDIGVYAVSFFSGLSDVDAITLSLGQLAADGKLGATTSISGIAIASVTNSAVKLAIVFMLGGLKLGWRLTQFYLLTLGIMVSIMFLTIY